MTSCEENDINIDKEFASFMEFEESMKKEEFYESDNDTCSTTNFKSVPAVDGKLTYAAG